MEIGSFIELELKKSGEFFGEDNDNVARLNSGRAAICHSLKLLNCSTIYIPYYICPEVKQFLKKKNITIRYYSISEDFKPLLSKNESRTAVLIENYFGLFSEKQIGGLIKNYTNVIIDNCAAFFAQPTPDLYTIYSCRKFFGVPDGSYLIGPDAGSKLNEYPKDYSSETASFLLKRYEFGCSSIYKERMKNEDRLNNSDVLRMSDLTLALMRSMDFKWIYKKRMENFIYASELYKKYNLLQIEEIVDEGSIPNFYPLVIRDKDLVIKLQEKKIYTGRRWQSVLRDVNASSFEAYLSMYMVPIPIDQRYGKEEIDYCFNAFRCSI